MRLLRVILAATLVAAASARPVAAQNDASRAAFDRITWVNGPVRGKLGDVAEVRVPESCRFTDDEGAKHFMEATENPAGGNELGVLLCQGSTEQANPWFVVFSFDESGYVKDDERDKLDADAILRTLRDGTNAGNDERRRRGWSTIAIAGWEKAPFYDPETHNLTWSTRLTSSDSPDGTINHSVRLLGRRGVMHADLVLSPSELAAAVPAFDGIVNDYTFASGHRYAEWRDGDRVAEYGLTALIAGGAGAAAVKLGLFGKLWKLVLAVAFALKKFVVVVLIGVGAAIKRFFGRRSGAPAGAR